MANSPRPAPAWAAAFRALERLLLVGGLLLFAFLLSRIGLDSLRYNLGLVGWGVVLIVLQELLAYAANTAGWLAAFTPPRPPIAFTALLRARIIGDAVNYVTPTAGLGGEFIRARLLRGQTSNTGVVAAITVAKVSQIVGQVAFVLLGLVVVLDDVVLPPGAGGGVLAGAMALALTALALVVALRRGMFGLVWRLAARLGVAQRFPEWERAIRRLDGEIAAFHHGAGRAFLWSSWWFFLGWLLGLVEVYLILTLLGIDASLRLALAIEVLSVAFDGIFFFVPAKLGTQEAGKVLIFRALGLDAAQGLAFGVLRHLRELAWSAIGLGLLWWQQRP